MGKTNWKKLGFEFFSIFIAVISAFALNNWNENRRDDKATNKILAEISNGLKKDIEDVKHNIKGHKEGIAACGFWRNIIQHKQVKTDSIQNFYFDLTRDFISLQNISGYETLKSRGLELIDDDSLRFEIITLYEYAYTLLRELEEEYYEMQYQENYFDKINEKIAPNFKFNEKGNIVGIKYPLKISPAEKNILLSYLLKIQVNRNFILRVYNQTEKELIRIQNKIEKKLE